MREELALTGVDMREEEAVYKSPNSTTDHVTGYIENMEISIGSIVDFYVSIDSKEKGREEG